MDASKHLSFSHGFSALLASAEFLVIVVNAGIASAHRLCARCVEIFIVNIINTWLNGSSFACSLHDLLDKNLCKHPALGIRHTTCNVCICKEPLTCVCVSAITTHSLNSIESISSCEQRFSHPRKKKKNW